MSVNVTLSKSNSRILRLTLMNMRFTVAGRARNGCPKSTIIMDLVHDILLFLWFQFTHIHKVQLIVR